jgi:putative flippase GtrA
MAGCVLSGSAMTSIDHLRARFPQVVSVIEARLVVLKKAISFALIGVVNSTIDAVVFFLVYAWFTAGPSVTWPFETVAALCRCGTPANIALVAANIIAWLVAISNSYVMNSSITFAAESGRKLRWRAYVAFLASGIVGLVGNTVTLVVLAQIAPVWVAKAGAILVSFVLNFSISHFVVFRPKRPTEAGEEV